MLPKNVSSSAKSGDPKFLPRDLSLSAGASKQNQPAQPVEPAFHENHGERDIRTKNKSILSYIDGDQKPLNRGAI